jgi:hypothetical protein
MTLSLARVLYWAPRILGLLFVGFLGLFVLEDAWHFIPAAVMLLAVLVAWKYELTGALLFAAAGTWYSIVARAHPSWILVVAGPLFLLAALFAAGPIAGTSTRSRVPPSPAPRNGRPGTRR